MITYTKQVGSFMIGLSSRSEEIILFCDTLNPSLREGLSQIWYDSSSIFCSLTPQDIMLVSVSFLNHGLVGDFFFFSFARRQFHNFQHGRDFIDHNNYSF